MRAFDVGRTRAAAAQDDGRQAAAPSENTVRDKTGGGSGAKLPQLAIQAGGKVTEVACNDDVSSGQWEMLSHPGPPGGLPCLVTFASKRAKSERTSETDERKTGQTGTK